MRPQDLVGFDVLVGLTFFDTEGQVLRQEQFHGTIERAAQGTTRVRPTDGGEARSIPFHPSAFRPAPGGRYRLASTDQVVDNPGLLTSWMFRPVVDERAGECLDAIPNLAPLGRNSRVPREWMLSYQRDEARIRRTIEQFGDEYIGRTSIIGVNHVGPDGDLQRQEQLLGTIMVVDLDEGVVVACEPDGRTFVLPGDPSWIEKAPTGVYRLRSTGQVLENPDYLAEVTIEQPE